MGTTWNWTVEDPALRADKAIQEALERDGQPLSRSQIQKLMEEGQITVQQNGVLGPPVGGGLRGGLRGGTKLNPGDVVVVHIPAPKKIETEAQDIPLEVLFEDEHLIVVNKPAGLTVHPCTTQTEGTLVNALLFHIKDLKGIGGALRPGIVHRIDKDTSGAFVVAKSEEAHQKLVSVFAAHEIQRTYRCFCYGSSRAQTGTIETTLGRNPRDRKKMAPNVKNGKVAITHYRRLQTYGLPNAPPFASEYEVTLETGRTHQIRVHFTAEGFSILGDPTYGTPTEKQSKWVNLPAEIKALVSALPGQALHAQTLGFEHPITGEALLLEAPPPKAFLDLQRALERYLS